MGVHCITFLLQMRQPFSVYSIYYYFQKLRGQKQPLSYVCFFEEYYINTLFLKNVMMVVTLTDIIST